MLAVRCAPRRASAPICRARSASSVQKKWKAEKRGSHGISQWVRALEFWCARHKRLLMAAGIFLAPPAKPREEPLEGRVECVENTFPAARGCPGRGSVAAGWGKEGVSVLAVLVAGASTLAGTGPFQVALRRSGLVRCIKRQCRRDFSCFQLSWELCFWSSPWLRVSCQFGKSRPTGLGTRPNRADFPIRDTEVLWESGRSIGSQAWSPERRVPERKAR